MFVCVALTRCREREHVVGGGNRSSHKSRDADENRFLHHLQRFPPQSAETLEGWHEMERGYAPRAFSTQTRRVCQPRAITR